MNERVLFVGEHGDNPCRWYRMVLPARGLIALGHRVTVSHGLIQGFDGRLRGLNGNVKEPPDIVVCRRLLSPDGTPAPNIDMFRQARKAGQRVFVDIDDNMFQLPDTNPASVWVTNDELAMWVADANATDGVLAVTPELAEVVAERVDVPVYVCPNSVNAHDYTPRGMAEHEPVRLGWMGLTSYRWHDLAIIVPCIERLLAERQCEFWHFGAHPEHHSLHDLTGWAGVREIPWTSIEQLPHLLGMVDAAIIPMDSNPFNVCRSPSTGLAWLAAGVPYVATATPSYDRLWNQGAGYVVDNDDMSAWENALNMITLPEYRDARDSQRAHGLAVARTRHTPKQVAQHYLDAFRSVVHA